MSRMNDHTKLVFAIEHILHLQDLIEENEAESYLVCTYNVYYDYQRKSKESSEI